MDLVDPDDLTDDLDKPMQMSPKRRKPNYTPNNWHAQGPKDLREMFDWFSFNHASMKLHEVPHGLDYTHVLAKNICHRRQRMLITASFAGTGGAEAVAALIATKTGEQECCVPPLIFGSF